MNKSKFLKKSLAMLLAILMVVAMIPLSAAATDATPEPDPTPAPEAPKPVITVNNRNATAPTEADGAYTATVDDATSVSVSWVPMTQEGFKAQMLTLRGVTVDLPFYRLDLTTEAEVVTPYNDDTKTITYGVEIILTRTVDDVKEEYKYPLHITAKTEAASDDVTLKSVNANTSFKINSTDYAFLGIENEIDDEKETVTIKLPLGYTPTDAGFDSAAFGTVANRGTGAALSSITDPQLRDQVVSQVFRPTADYSTVGYTFNNGQGQVTVTARDGRTKNYAVIFEQEDALKDVSVTLAKDTTAEATYPVASEYVDLDGAPTMDAAFNPNGSAWAIEGLTSPDGRVLGKMGHSERIGPSLYRNVPGVYDMGLFRSAARYFR